MKVTKSDFYLNLKNIFSNSCGMYLHGISDNPDIENKYSTLSNEEIALRIMQEGLYNNYWGTIVRTIMPFGRINDVNNKVKCTDFTEYTPYRSNPPYTNILLAIPTCFIDTDGNKYFGGWIEKNNYLTREYNSLLDKALKGKTIPKEFILGYYNFTRDNDELEFIPNKDHYYFMTKEEQTEFIKKYELDKMFNIDKDYDEYYAKQLYDDSLELSFLNQIKRFKNENEPIITNLDYNSFTFQKYPSFETIMDGEIDIRKELINHTFNNFNLLNGVSFFLYNKDLINQEIIPEYFEEWVLSYGNSPIKLYKYLYDNYKEEVLNIYYSKLQELNNGTNALSMQ